MAVYTCGICVSKQCPYMNESIAFICQWCIYMLVDVAWMRCMLRYMYVGYVRYTIPLLNVGHRVAVYICGMCVGIRSPYVSESIVYISGWIGHGWQSVWRYIHVGYVWVYETLT